MFSLIDSGSYGKIYADSSSSNVVKVVDLFIDGVLCSSTLRELNVHSLISYINCEFMIKTTHIKIKNDKVYIHMRYEGKTLTQWISMANVDIISKNFLKIFKQLALSLDILNRLGLVHGDLKPDNIVVNRYAKLIDFGASTLFGVKTNFCLCTEEFRPPELEEKNCVYNEKSDIFSLALVLSYIISNKYYIKNKNYDFLSFKEDISSCNYINNKIKNLLIRMGDINQENRPSFIEILESLDIKSINIDKLIDRKKIDLEKIKNIEKIENIEKYIINFLKNMNKNQYIDICISNFNKFLLKTKKTENLQTFSTISILLYISIVENIDISLNDINKFLENKYNIEEINMFVQEYIISMNFLLI
jgi:serine/threonine protein kinase